MSSSKEVRKGKKMRTGIKEVVVDRVARLANIGLQVSSFEKCIRDPFEGLRAMHRAWAGDPRGM
jgi:hypothetical protein